MQIVYERIPKTDEAGISSARPLVIARKLEKSDTDNMSSIEELEDVKQQRNDDSTQKARLALYHFCSVVSVISV